MRSHERNKVETKNLAIKHHPSVRGRRNQGGLFLERKYIMNTFKCTLEIINMSEWLQHISDVLQQTQNTEDILERICDFDFKFDTILQ